MDARGRPAVFLDRDGTLVEARHFPSLPEQLVLAADAAPELRRLQWAGFRLIVITNQSGIARGFFNEAELRRMHEHLIDVLGRQGVWLDGIYHCPHHPDGVIRELAIACDCRKPRPGLLLRASAELGIDLARSWFAGDILDDVEAGRRAGCRAILVDLGTESLPERDERRPDFVARSTAHALRIVRAVEGIGPPEQLDYRPASWIARQPLPVSDLDAASGARP